MNRLPDELIAELKNKSSLLFPALMIHKIRFPFSLNTSIFKSCEKQNEKKWGLGGGTIIFVWINKQQSTRDSMEVLKKYFVVLFQFKNQNKFKCFSKTGVT